MAEVMVRQVCRTRKPSSIKTVVMNGDSCIKCFLKLFCLIDDWVVQNAIGLTTESIFRGQVFAYCLTDEFSLMVRELIATVTLCLRNHAEFLVNICERNASSRDCP